jgi:hypothetical protein
MPRIEEQEPQFQIGFWRTKYEIERERSKVLAEQHQAMCLKYDVLLLKLEDSYPLPVEGQDDIDELKQELSNYKRNLNREPF